MAKEPTIDILLYAQTDIGMVRHGNEDNFLVVDLTTAESWTAENADKAPESLLSFSQSKNGSLIAVTDGMGGALAGEVASQMAVNSVRDRMLQFISTPAFAQLPFHEKLRLSIEQANYQINNESQNNVEYSGMGATFTAAGLDGDTAYLAQVGDSRCYLVRQQKIAQMTKDQSLVSQLVDAGHITEEEAESHTYKNVILQALGAQPKVNVIVDKFKLYRGDTLLLCSDGLSGKVKGKEMLEIIVNTPDIKQACAALIKLANERGGEDNITVLIARFLGDGLSEPDTDGPQKPEFVPRDPTLPDEIDISQLSSFEEDTLKPEPRPSLRAAERVDVVETQEVQATMLSLPAVTPQMIAAHTSQSTATEPPKENEESSLSSGKNGQPAPKIVSSEKKGFSSVLIIIVVVVVILATVYLVMQYLNKQQSAAPQPVPQQVTAQKIPEPAPTPLPSKLEEEFNLSMVNEAIDKLTEKAALLRPQEKRKLEDSLKAIRLRVKKLNLPDRPLSDEEINKESKALLAELAELDKKYSKEATPAENIATQPPDPKNN